MNLFFIVSLASALVLFFLLTSHLIIEKIIFTLPSFAMFILFFGGAFFVLEGFFKNNFFGLFEVVIGFTLVFFGGVNSLISIYTKNTVQKKLAAK